jgi:hypothetical protein
MNTQKNRLSFLLLTCWLAVAGASQALAQDDPGMIRALLEKMRKAYRNASHLGFRVQYLYANAGQPGHHLDSLSGEVEIDKDRSRFVIDGTETLVNSRYTIHVIRMNKMIYLSKPGHSGLMDPVGLLDSVLAHQEGMKAGLEKTDAYQTLVVTFPPGQPYTQVRMTIDNRTGLLAKLEYALHTGAVVGQQMIERPGHPGLYQPEGRVEVIFSHYQKGGFGDELFDEGNYFTRTGDRYTPVGSYKEYHIFLASSHL